jgi:RNA recognition motif-containing protein
VEKKLYVGNLSYDTTNAGLESLFAQAGAVAEATVVTDRDTGRSRGFGFVEMADVAGATAALEQFNGKELDGRSIKVAAAKPRAPRENRGYGGGNRGSW